MSFSNIDKGKMFDFQNWNKTTQKNRVSIFGCWLKIVALLIGSCVCLRCVDWWFVGVLVKDFLQLTY